MDSYKKPDFEQPTYPLRTKGMTTAKQAPNEQQLRDTFHTPRYAVDLLIPYIPKHISHVWECAAGGRKISRQLLLAGYTVLETDIKEEEEITPYNFINDNPRTDIDERFSIITNPPFSIKDLFIEKCFEYNRPFALLINADYSKWQIDLIKRGCEKIIPTSRIAYITPFALDRANALYGNIYKHVDEVPSEVLYKHSGAQFHSMWLTYGFNLGRTETFADLTPKQRKENI